MDIDRECLEKLERDEWIEGTDGKTVRKREAGLASND